MKGIWNYKNACYNSVKDLYVCPSYRRNLKTACINWPDILYGCGKWCLTVTEENRWIVYENKVPGIFTGSSRWTGKTGEPCASPNTYTVTIFVPLKIYVTLAYVLFTCKRRIILLKSNSDLKYKIQNSYGCNINVWPQHKLHSRCLSTLCTCVTRTTEWVLSDEARRQHVLFYKFYEH